MLRAALIGFASSGKTTLFQLMTSARETARATHGKAEASIGISKVPDARLDRLTAMFNPRKRVPATVEFSDLAAPGRTGGAQALVDVVIGGKLALLQRVAGHGGLEVLVGEAGGHQGEEPGQIGGITGDVPRAIGPGERGLRLRQADRRSQGIEIAETTGADVKKTVRGTDHRIKTELGAKPHEQ